MPPKQRSGPIENRDRPRTDERGMKHEIRGRRVRERKSGEGQERHEAKKPDGDVHKHRIEERENQFGTSYAECREE